MDVDRTTSSVKSTLDQRSSAMEMSPAKPLFPAPIGLTVKSLKTYIEYIIVVSIALWRLVYAFIEEKECSKEEKTLGQSWEIARIS
jgi:hypothetical protein